MIIILLIWAVLATVVAIVAIANYSKHNYRFTRARKILFEMAGRDHDNVAKFCRQRNALHDAILKICNDFPSFSLGDLVSMEQERIFSEVSKELNGDS